MQVTKQRGKQKTKSNNSDLLKDNIQNVRNLTKALWDKWNNRKAELRLGGEE